jgi:hypothetical protein
LNVLRLEPRLFGAPTDFCRSNVAARSQAGYDPRRLAH